MEILFRGRRKDNGEWIEGDYAWFIRKADLHTIRERITNEYHNIYRDSLQQKDHNAEWEDV